MPKNLIETKPGHYVIGEQIKTRGNDEEYPTFILEDGSRIGTHHSKVGIEIKEEEES